MGVIGLSLAIERQKHVTHQEACRTANELLSVTAQKESGAKTYSALNRNDHGAGVSFGLIQFNQRHGGLGALLRRMYERDPDAFIAATYGDTPANKDPEALVKRLLDELDDPNRSLSGSLTRAMAGAIWVRRFKALGAIPAFQDVQDKLANELFVEPAVVLAAEYGLRSERAIALVIDISVQHGFGGAREILASAFKLNPRDTKEMNDATDECRAEEEHDMLVHIAERSARRVQDSPSVLRAVINRRTHILHDKSLSDSASPLQKPVEKIRPQPRPMGPFALPQPEDFRLGFGFSIEG